MIGEFEFRKEVVVSGKLSSSSDIPTTFTQLKGHGKRLPFHCSSNPVQSLTASLTVLSNRKHCWSPSKPSTRSLKFSVACDCVRHSKNTGYVACATSTVCCSKGYELCVGLRHRTYLVPFERTIGVTTYTQQRHAVYNTSP
jgi:hypothetical protein